MARWRDLRVNDWIVCPVSGLHEQVTMSKSRSAGRRFVRTTRHDHIRPADELVERIDKRTLPRINGGRVR